MLILEILKWIGIVLLYLLLFVLIMLLLVLFLPIKYSGEGTYNSEKQFAIVKARWFWGLVRVKGTFPDKPYLSVKLLWIELIKPKAEPKEVGEKEENVEPKMHAATAPSIPKEEKQQEAKQEAQKEKETSPQGEQIEEEVKKEKEPFYKKWIGIKDKIQYYITILTQQETKDLIAHCKMRILKILKSIRPRKINFYGRVGFDSPDTTGYLYGGYCMISSYLGKNIILIPEFEKEVVDVSGSLKGHITIFILLWNALRIYLDKRFMRLISKLKKGGR